MKTLTSAILSLLLLGTSISAAGKKDDEISGKWEVFRGKAIDNLVLTNKDGILKGTLTEDIRWGGKSWAVSGMNVGDKVTLSYSTKKENSLTSVTADFSLTGKLEGGKMSGEYELRLVSTRLSSGESTPLNSDGLWIAKRPEQKKEGEQSGDGDAEEAP